MIELNFSGVLNKYNTTVAQVSKSRWITEFFTADAADAALGNICNGKPLVPGQKYKAIICQENYTSEKGRDWKIGDVIVMEAKLS